jgi:hypothetical protein
VVGSLLALLVVGLLVFVSCGVPGGGGEGDDASRDVGDLDARAEAACDLYTPIAEEVRSGELSGPPLFRALQDVYNEARLSESQEFGTLVQDVLNASITEDEQARDERLDRLDEVCPD